MSASNGKNEVYLVQHTYYMDDEDEIEETKIIGIYSSRANAEEAVEKYKRLEGFSRYPDGFHIDAYELNEGCWVEGFVTIRPGDV